MSAKYTQGFSGNSFTITRNSSVTQKLGSVFGRTDFSRNFIFGLPDFSADFLAGFFLLIFVEESAQKNPPGKSRQNPPKIIQQKSPDTFLQRGRTNKRVLPSYLYNRRVNFDSTLH